MQTFKMLLFFTIINVNRLLKKSKPIYFGKLKKNTNKL